MQKSTLLTSLFIAGFGLSACQTTTNGQQALTDTIAPIEERIAGATCENGIAQRDKWLASEKPDWATYAVGHKKATGSAPGRDTLPAYRAYLDAGQDHAKAETLFNERHPDWQSTYPRRAKCWVQHEG